MMNHKKKLVISFISKFLATAFVIIVILFIISAFIFVWRTIVIVLQVDSKFLGCIIFMLSFIFALSLTGCENSEDK